MKKQYISPKLENSEFVLAARIACGSGDAQSEDDDHIKGPPGGHGHAPGGGGNHNPGHGHGHGH